MSNPRRIESTPGFLRRLGAIAYDIILLLSMLFLATAFVLPFNNGQAFQPGQSLYLIYLLICSFLFFGWFWTHGGQTLGMRVWKIKVCTYKNEPINWQQALVRFIIGILSWSVLGLGVIWAFFDKKNRSWHDLLSKTQLVWHERK